MGPFTKGLIFLLTLLLAPAYVGMSQTTGLGTPKLQLPVLPYLPTSASIKLQSQNSKTAASAELSYRKAGQTHWLSAPKFDLAPYEFFEWSLTELTPASAYEYELKMTGISTNSPGKTYYGRFKTMADGNDSFKVAIITDSHIGPFPDGKRRLNTLKKIAHKAAEHNPDFTMALGDNVGWSGSKRNVKDPKLARQAYSMYRKGLAPLLNQGSYFGVIGNWEGENAIVPKTERHHARDIRQRYMPGPDHTYGTYGGSSQQDYYAVKWGDALFIVLNVQSYSYPSKPAAEIEPYLEVADLKDWTLGKRQWQWLEKTLKAATEKQKFLLIHHVVGGKAPTERETLYGRGGGLAAHTGEQSRLHKLMIESGVSIMFYGHDHVFTDSIVDGVHYTLPGSAGIPKKFDKKWTGYDKYWSHSGYAILEVRDDDASVTFYNQSGKTLHSYNTAPRARKASAE